MNAQPRLLVIDDEEPLCTSAVRIFKPRGFEVDTSTSPVEGLRRATSEPYSAVLLDMRMPEMDGLTFLRRLRESGSVVPVIVVTGYASVDDAAAFMRMGAVDYLAKPFTPAEVSEAVRRVVGAAPVLPVAPALTHPERHWLGNSWLQVADDGTAVVGARIAGARSVQLPLPGDEVRRGLPCGLVHLESGEIEPLRAPVSGVVAQVRADAGCLARDEWVVRIRAKDLAADLEVLSDVPVEHAEATPVTPSANPRVVELVHRVELRNHRGERVAISATGDMLRASQGLGAAILAEVKERSLPSRLSLGSRVRDTLEVMDCAARFERTLLLEVSTRPRFAGTLERTDGRSSLLQATGLDTSRVRGYAIQSMGDAQGLCLDEATARTLARILVDEVLG